MHYIISIRKPSSALHPAPLPMALLLHSAVTHFFILAALVMIFWAGFSLICYNSYGIFRRLTHPVPVPIVPALNYTAAIFIGKIFREKLPKKRNYVVSRAFPSVWVVGIMLHGRGVTLPASAREFGWMG